MIWGCIAHILYFETISLIQSFQMLRTLALGVWFSLRQGQDTALHDCSAWRRGKEKCLAYSSVRRSGRLST